MTNYDTNDAPAEHDCAAIEERLSWERHRRKSLEATLANVEALALAWEKEVAEFTAHTYEMRVAGYALQECAKELRIVIGRGRHD